MAEVIETEILRFMPRRVLLASAIAGTIGLVVAAIAIALDPRRALLGYLAAYTAVTVVVVGALVLLLIGYATNARWLAPLRRLQEAIVIALPALAVLFIPIAVGLDHIYVWAAPPADLPAHQLHLLAAKQAWLDPVGFVIRAFVYLAIFVIAAEVLRRWSRRRDGQVTAPEVDPEVQLRRERRFASAMLPPVGLALTFAAFDWLMSLQPLWFSSMFPVYVFAAGFDASIALLAILAWRLRAGGCAPTITPHHFHALSRLLFAFVVFWTYCNYFQGFLIQIANRPIEVTFFIVRTRDGWWAVLWAVLITRFVLPFCLLLPRRLKFRPRYVAAVAAIVLLGHVLDIFWLVIPSTGEGLSVHIADLAALIGIAGACVAFSAWRLRGVPVVSTGDPFLAAGSRYQSPT